MHSPVENQVLMLDIKLALASLYVCVSIRYNDVLQRCKELDSWTQDLSLPSVVWLSGLFNPQSFLTGRNTFVHKGKIRPRHVYMFIFLLCLLFINPLRFSDILAF